MNVHVNNMLKCFFNSKEPRNDTEAPGFPRAPERESHPCSMYSLSPKRDQGGRDREP